MFVTTYVASYLLIKTWPFSNRLPGFFVWHSSSSWSSLPNAAKLRQLILESVATIVTVRGKRLFCSAKRRDRLWCPFSLIFSGSGRGALLPGINRLDCEADHFPPCNVEVMNERSSTSIIWTDEHDLLMKHSEFEILLWNRK